jgi:hypothetical protein
MDGLNITDAKLAQDLVKSRRKALAPETALQGTKQTMSQIKVAQAGAKVDAKNIKTQLKVSDEAEAKFYEDAKKITGVGVADIQKSITHFKTQFKEGALLPPEVRKLVDSSGTIDDFVNTAKKMSTQELDTAMKFLPPNEQAGFKQNLGDSIIFDFFARSYDPDTKMFTRAGKYVQENGLPNLEFFTGSPDAQKRFSELAQAITEAGNKTPVSQMTLGQVGTGMKNYAIRGVVLGGLLAVFSNSKFHVENSLLNATGATGAAILVSIPYIVSSAMRNPNLAEDFIKFTKSGGTLTYAQLPYLATFLKKEGKLMNEQELADQQKMADDIVKSGAPNTAQQMPQGQSSQPQGPQQGQPQIDPGQGAPTPEQIQIMQSMAAARAGLNPQGQQGQGSSVQTQPQVLPPQPNQPQQ